MEGPPVEKEKTLWPDTSFPESVFTPGLQSEFTADPCGEISFEIIDPIFSVRPPAVPFSGHSISKGSMQSARVTEGHHLL